MIVNFIEVWTEELGSPDFQGGLGTSAMELMCNMKKTLWVTGKTYIMDSSLCALKGLVGILDIDLYGSLLAKKFRNRKKGIYGYEINAHSLKKVKMTASKNIGRVSTLIY